MFFVYLDNSALSGVSFVNIFSQSVACFLNLLTLFFTEHKFLIVLKSRLLIISFLNCFLDVLSKKASLYPRASRYCPVLSSRSYSFAFTFRSMIHFELTFVKDISSLSIFIFLF